MLMTRGGGGELYDGGGDGDLWKKKGRKERVKTLERSEEVI